MLSLGIIAYRFAVPCFILIFFLILSLVIYTVLKRRVSFFYFIFPLLLVTGYVLMLSASRESSFVRGLNEKGRSPCEISGTVQKTQKTESGYKITLGRVKLISDGGRLENCIVYTDREYGRGAMLRIKGTAAAFDTAKNPGEFDSRQYYRTLRVAFKLYAEEISFVKNNALFVTGLADRLSKKLRASLYSVTDSASASVFAAMLLGEKDGLDTELSELFAAYGIGHILAISGLHVSLIGMGLYKILRKSGAGYTVSMLFGSAVVLFYGIMTGNGISTVRAIIMYIASVYANAAGRTYDMLSAASLAAIVMLVPNPMLLYNCGFQLSFGAVLGIILIAGNVSKAFGITGKLPSAFVTSVSVQAATLPVIMWNYYEVPVLSVFINMLVVPLMTVVMVSAVAGGIAGIMNVYAGSFCIGPGVLVIKLYRLLCAANAKLPWAVLVCGRPKAWQIALYYLMLAAAVFIVKKYSGRYKISVLAFIPAFVILLCRYKDGFEADFLYVGQGDGIFIRGGNGTAFLVDGGSSDKKSLYEYTLEPFLMSKGVSRLDYAIVTHCDSDHISGLEELLKNGRIRVDTVYMPESDAYDEAYDGLWKTAEESGACVRTIHCGMRLTAGSTRITCIYPEQGGSDTERNGNSTVLVVENNDFSMLLTGDIGEEQEKELCETVSGFAPFDVLKSAHHGSKNSNSAEFIKAASPKNIVISCGKDNRYGHPHEEALERMGEFGAVIYRTDEQGAVVFGG